MKAAYYLDIGDAFNRTSMESKRFSWWRVYIHMERTFNRTSMESKRFQGYLLIQIHLSFNRTSMESKLRIAEKRLKIGEFLLIEPVWNRNLVD